MPLIRKMRKGEDFLIFIVVCFFAFFVFVASLWMIDVSASAMLMSASCGTSITMKNMFLEADPNVVYHAGLFLATMTFYFILMSAINSKWKDFRKKFKG